MSASDRTGMQIADNQDPVRANVGTGRLIWNNLTKTFFQIDEDEKLTELIQTTALNENHTTLPADTSFSITTEGTVFTNTVDNNQQINLPPATAIRIHTIKKIAVANITTITPNGSDKVEKLTCLKIYDKNESITLESDGVSNWNIKAAYQPRFENLTTGVIEGCGVTPGTLSTQYSVASGKVTIEDWRTVPGMRLRRLDFDGVTDRTPPNAGTTNFFTTVLLIQDPTNPDKAIILEEENGGTGFSGTTRRDQIALTALIHAAPGGAITAISDDLQLAYQMHQALLDMVAIQPAINVGNLIAPNGVNLNGDRGAGVTNKPYVNAGTNRQLPVPKVNIAATAFDFIYQIQPGVTFLQFGILFDPDNYDNVGVLTVVPNNNWTIQRVYFFGQTPSTAIMYGQTLYGSEAAAVAAIETEVFIVPSNTVDAVWISSLVMKKGTTDLSNAENSIVNRKANE